MMVDVDVSKLRLQIWRFLGKQANGLLIIAANKWLMFNIETNCCKESIPPSYFLGCTR
jgi:hypothetical protein